ncbi:AlbA family DNA-binding domain-containing protein (plasmid) [Streptosporangium sp. CA-135522]|uniref:AlbA family DNA-binding domain-containing protein n=1 Tax=Streptosporangium sp. CA-135522 TaxID=3240072 RepID=UPI003D8C67E3
MALNFDTRTAPRNHAELKKLVLAVRGATKADETLWLEWKSELDLDPEDPADKSGRAHIARAIIGFANRMPDEASRFVEGYGFFLAGVSHENMGGVEQHDITELVRWIGDYVGETIRWQPTYVEVEGGDGAVAVLVIMIDPPRWGDPIFCMRKQAPSPKKDKSIPEATVFVRRTEGTTSRARATDLDALGERLIRRAPSLDLALSVAQGEAKPITCHEDDVAKVLSYLETRALATLQEGPDEPLAGLAVAFDRLKERREARFREEVQEYLRECRIAIPDGIAEAAAVNVKPLILRLHNQTDTFLGSVQVLLRIHGNVRALEPEWPSYAINERFPRALPVPPSFSRGARSSFGPDAVLSPNLSGLSNLRSAHAGPPIRIDNFGPVTIELPPVDLRSGRHADLAPFVLLVEEDEGEGITAEWTATATNMNGSISGQLHITCAEPQSFIELFAADPRDRQDR